MFQKVIYQQKYQKYSWMCKSVCLVSFKCLLTVSYSLQSTWCTDPASSQAHQAPHYWDTALCCKLAIGHLHVLLYTRCQFRTVRGHLPCSSESIVLLTLFPRLMIAALIFQLQVHPLQVMENCFIAIKHWALIHRLVIAY